jgi:hypothetical protein
MDTHHTSRSRALGRWGGVAFVAFAASVFACSPAVLTRLVEAQRLGSALHVAFSRTTAAGDRAVMATDDETAAAAVDEARALMATVDRHQTELEESLQTLDYQGDLRQLAAFKTRFEEYRRLTEDVLTRVLENTNEIVDLSRRNSSVRALALSLGRRRVLSADAEAQLDALGKGLAQHEFTATR